MIVGFSWLSRVCSNVLSVVCWRFMIGMIYKCLYIFNVEVVDGSVLDVWCVVGSGLFGVGWSVVCGGYCCVGVVF